jgi:hypothetical protein
VKAGGALAVLLPLLAAASDAQLQPGLWEVINTPGAITLDGRELDDVPLSPARTQRICLPSAQAAEPARFFARELAEDCRIISAAVAGGAVAIRASCPNPEEGTDGALELNGRFDRAGYQLDFTSRSEDFQGVTTFSGKLTGRHLGPCPTG